MPLKNVLLILSLLNLISFTLMAIDKWKAKNNYRRIPEKFLFLAALCFGAAGIMLAMVSPVSHKSSKWSFKIGIPLLLVLNLICIYFMENYLLGISI